MAGGAGLADPSGGEKKSPPACVSRGEEEVDGGARDRRGKVSTAAAGSIGVSRRWPPTSMACASTAFRCRHRLSLALKSAMETGSIVGAVQLFVILR